jgi:hypothetical protein
VLSASDIEVADVDGDGHLDLVQAQWRMPNNTGGVAVSVSLNRGDGTFATAVTYAGDIQAQSVAAADFNGDGRPDLALVNDIYDLDILINQGDGRFFPFVTRAAPASAVVMATADFDGDGRVDLAVTTQDHSLDILLGQGDGSFAAPVSYPAGNIVAAIVVSDLDLDGHPDIAVSSTSYAGGPGLPTSLAEGAVDIFLNRGDGTFAPRVSYPAGKGTVTIAVADFNGDGAPDVAAGNTIDNTVSVFFNQGHGTFDLPITYEGVGGVSFNRVLSGGIGGLEAMDFDGDGRADLAVVGTDGHGKGAITLLTNAGDGTLLAAETYALSTTPTASAAADLNLDGLPDLAVILSDNTTGVILSTCQ